MVLISHFASILPNKATHFGWLQRVPKLLYVLQSNNIILSALVNGEVSSFRKSVDVRGDVVFGVEDQGLFRLNTTSGSF